MPCRLNEYEIACAESFHQFKFPERDISLDKDHHETERIIGFEVRAQFRPQGTVNAKFAVISI